MKLESYKEILIEKYIPGREIQVAVLSDKVLGAIELRPKRKFYDYEAKYNPNANTEHIIPVDISKSQIDYAQKKYDKNCDFLTLEVFKFKDYENTFDVITVLGLFEFIDDDEVNRLLNKFYSLLKNGGKLIITTPNFNKLMATMSVSTLLILYVAIKI